MLFVIDSALDLAATMVGLGLAFWLAALAAVSRSPRRPLWRSMVGSGAIVAAAFVIITTIGADIELRWRGGITASWALGGQWLSWVVGPLLALAGALVLWFKSDPDWGTPLPLRPIEKSGLAVAVFAAVMLVVFLLPVWDVHPCCWMNGNHGHSYFGRGFHYGPYAGC